MARLATRTVVRAVVLMLTPLSACAHTPAQSAAQTSAAAATPRPAIVRRASDTPKPATGSPAPADNSIYFDLDAYTLRADAGPVLRQVADAARRTGRTVRIEGNCDDRGTVEYNLALGEQRARTAQHYLERLGVPSDRISVVSYGSQRPVATGDNESAWARNRRDDLVMRWRAGHSGAAGRPGQAGSAVGFVLGCGVSIGGVGGGF